MPITTRIATIADRGRLYNLYCEAMTGYIEEIWGWDEIWQQNDFEEAFETCATYVIESDSGFSGYYQLKFGEDTDRLQMLILTPAMRSLGIGRQLLHRTSTTSDEHGRRLLLRVFRINTAAKRFYENNGWVVIAEEAAFYLMENPSYSTPRAPDTSFPRTIESYAFVID